MNFRGAYSFLALTAFNRLVVKTAGLADERQSDLARGPSGVAGKISRRAKGDKSEKGDLSIIVELVMPDMSVPDAAEAEERRGRAKAFAEKYGLVTDELYGATITGFSASNVSRGLYDALLQNPDVKMVDINEMVTFNVTELDPSSVTGSDGMGDEEPIRGRRTLQTVAQEVPWNINYVNAYGHGIDTSNKRVCVMDTGIDLNNRDLNVSPDCFNAFDSRASCQDEDGHGTHVAGTIAALDNGIDTVGVAPGATIVPLKVMRGNPPFGSWSGLIAGMEWAAENNCDIVNMSLEAPFNVCGNDAAEALAESGVKVVTIAGNSRRDAKDTSPATADHPDLYTVSAMNGLSRLASFSNFGPAVDVAAPGDFIDSLSLGGGIESRRGTSFAAPLVAGLLLLDGSLCFDGVLTYDRDDNPDPIVTKCSGQFSTAATRGSTSSTISSSITSTTTTTTSTFPPRCLRKGERCNSSFECCSLKCRKKKCS